MARCPAGRIGSADKTPRDRLMPQQIRRLRRIFIILVFGWPIFGVLAFEAGIPLGLILMWHLMVVVMWQVLWWTRCPRCDGFFFSRIMFFFFAVISIFRRRCCNCGLDIRPLG